MEVSKEYIFVHIKLIPLPNQSQIYLSLNLKPNKKDELLCYSNNVNKY